MDVAAQKQSRVPFAGLWRQYGLLAVIGGVFIGVTGPVLLVSWHRRFRSYIHIVDGSFAADQPAVSSQQGLMTLLDLEFTALIACGPLATLFAMLVYKAQRNQCQDIGNNLRQFVCDGMIFASVLSTFNLPAWFVQGLIYHDDIRLRLIFSFLLFLVAGATAGLWISWQAWRYHHPEAPLLPRYSLKTLLAVIFAWGLQLAIFQPA